VAGVDVWEEPGVAGQKGGPGSVNCFVPVIVFSAFAPLSAGGCGQERPGAQQRERVALGSILAQIFYLSNPLSESGVTTDRRKVVEKHKRGTMLPD
jgi:hypothetical protein